MAFDSKNQVERPTNLNNLYVSHISLSINSFVLLISWFLSLIDSCLDLTDNCAIFLSDFY